MSLLFSASYRKYRLCTETLTKYSQKPWKYNNFQINRSRHREITMTDYTKNDSKGKGTCWVHRLQVLSHTVTVATLIISSQNKLFSFHTHDMLICKSEQSPDMKTGNVVKSVCVVPHVSLLSLHSSHTQTALLLDGLQLICANGLCD